MKPLSSQIILKIVLCFLISDDVWSEHRVRSVKYSQLEKSLFKARDGARERVVEDSTVDHQINGEFGPICVGCWF